MRPLAARASGPELMDDPALDPSVLAAVLSDLAQVNRVTLAGRPTVAFLARATRGMARFRLLDVGFGQGDMLRRIARWAERRGIAADLVGIDMNPASLPAARAATPAAMPIRYLAGDYRGLAGSGFDFVVSSLVAHHMDEDELIAFLRFMTAEARRGWLVNDLHRHRFAHLAFPWLARAMRWHPIVRHDGTLSIARSFRAADWAALLDRAGIAGAVVKRRFPFRLCVEWLRAPSLR